MPSRVTTLAAALAAALALSGCAAQDGTRPVEASPQAPQWDQRSRTEIGDLLAASARRATAAIETLVMIEKARTQPAASPIEETGLPEELARLATIEWSGPAQELVQKIAEGVGYGFSVSGRRPATPVMAQVSQRDQPIAKALENVGMQAVRFATVVVDPNRRKIEFRYDAASR